MANDFSSKIDIFFEEVVSQSRSKAQSITALGALLLRFMLSSLVYIGISFSPYGLVSAESISLHIYNLT